MALLESMMESFVLMNELREEDGAGGFVSEWKDGPSFLGVITLDTTMESRTAQKQGVTSVYTLTVTKSCNLRYNDVIKRERDGKIFRLTSDPDDKQSPDIATLDIKQATAERWKLT